MLLSLLRALEMLVTKVSRARLEFKELPVRKETKVFKEHKVSKGIKDLQACRDSKA